MYTLIVNNKTSNPLSYLSGSVVVPANSSLTIPVNYHFDLITDGQFRHDISSGGKADVTDGVTTYGNTDALNYIDSIIGTKDKDGRGITSTASGSIRAMDVNVISSVSIPVEDYNAIYLFNDISSVAPSVETAIVSYTVPVGKTATISLCELSGTNIATFNLYVDSTLISRKRTFFGNLNSDMQFTNKGYELTAGQVVLLKVIHTRSYNGDFEANLQIKESL